MIPSFEPKPLSCRCGHEWTGHLPVNVTVTIWIAHVEDLICPSCGGGFKKIMLSHKPRETPVDTELSITERYQRWKNSEDTGLSSACLGHLMMTGWVAARRDYPHDPDDLGRCLRLLRIIPEWRPRVMEMAVCGPVWAALAARWDDLEKSMTREVGIFWEKGTAAPKTYSMIEQIIKEASK